MKYSLYLQKNGVFLTADSGTFIRLFGGLNFKCPTYVEYQIIETDDGNVSYLEISQDRKKAILHNEKPVYDEKTGIYTYKAGSLKIDLRVDRIEPEFDFAAFKNRLLMVKCVECGGPGFPKSDK